MKLIVDQNKLKEYPENFLRRAGYGFIRDRRSGQESFVRRMTRDHYPRFHMYVNLEQGNVVFNLHLDQKKPSYKGSHAHSAEYDGAIVSSEIERLKGLLDQNNLFDLPEEKKEEKKGLFGRLFG